MKVLVTGGTGVVGVATVNALRKLGHAARILSREASAGAARWEGVEARNGNVDKPSDVRGAAAGCDVIIHIAGIVAEDPPNVTFEKVNVQGTLNVVEEARASGVERLVFVSSLGADRGSSAYHRSKIAAEEIVRSFEGSWVICRLGNVYGTGDEVMSVLLRWMRATPVMPVVGSGDDPFQPLWWEDAGVALAGCVERDDLSGRTLDVAGPVRTSINDVLDRMGRIIGREPARIPIPTPIVGIGAALGDLVGVKLPVNESHLAMLREQSLSDSNALELLLRAAPTGLDEGLRKLADSLPEQLQQQGFGASALRRFWADIAGSTLTAEQLFARFRTRFSEFTPWTMDVDAEPGTPDTIEQGATLTMALPLRGNIQVRVVDLGERYVTLATVAGHPLAGTVTFRTEDSGATIRFEAEVRDRAAGFADWVMMETAGRFLQRFSWHELIGNVVRESGGHAPDGVHEEIRELEEQDANEADKRLVDLVSASQRNAGGRTVFADSRPEAR